MKKYEFESFIKSFLLFFITLLSLNVIIFAFYYHEQKTTLNGKIFDKIKLYNYTFKDKDISIDIVPYKKAQELYVLQQKNSEIYALFDIPNSKQNSLKIIYNSNLYQQSLSNIKKQTLLYFTLATLLLGVLSLFYSWYALRPLKDALHLLEEFLKDLIHDLNTPVSSILLNIKLLEKKSSKEALKRIEYGIKNISSLYKNLEASIKEEEPDFQTIDAKEFFEPKINALEYLYPHLHFTLLLETDSLFSSPKELSRIIDNLLSNACKYNTPEGTVSISIFQDKISIQDTGVGIKNPKKAFQRFYKESQRGLGIGLHIVKKLCKKLNIGISLHSNPKGTLVELTLR